MSRMEISRRVAAPAATTWEVMTDLPNWTATISAIEVVERLDDGTSFGVGTRWRETRTMFGKEATEELEVTSMDPGRSYVVEADSRGAHYRSVSTVEPDGDAACTLTMTFEAEPDGLLSKVMATTIGKLFEGATRKALEQDLAEVAAAAEARAGA